MTESYHDARPVGTSPRRFNARPFVPNFEGPKRPRESNLSDEDLVRLSPAERAALRWLNPARRIKSRLPNHGSDTRPHVAAALRGIDERPGRPLSSEMAILIYEALEACQRDNGVLHVTWAKVAELVNERGLQAWNRARARRRQPPIKGHATKAKVAAVVKHLVGYGWLAWERQTCRQDVYVASAPRFDGPTVPLFGQTLRTPPPAAPAPLPPPAPIEFRLPNLRATTTLRHHFAGIRIPRTRRIVPGMAALMIYDEIEWLTRPTGRLGIRWDTLTERVQTAVDRRNKARFTKLGTIRAEWVQAVVAHLGKLGWLTVMRSVWGASAVVARAASAVAVGDLDNLVSVPEGTRSRCTSDQISETRVGTVRQTQTHRQTDDLEGDEWAYSPYGASLSRDGRARARDLARAAEETRLREAAGRACAVVDRWREKLSCQGAPNPAGAWFRHLRDRFSIFNAGSGQERAQADVEHAIGRMVAQFGSAGLSADGISRFLPTRLDTYRHGVLSSSV